MIFFEKTSIFCRTIFALCAFVKKKMLGRDNFQLSILLFLLNLGVTPAGVRE
jgi:hypothetical protein